MTPGITARTFARPTLEAVLDAVAGHGLSCIQFNFACAGLPSMPDRLEPALLDRVRAACQARGLAMAAVSGTFNLIHPDPRQRAEGLRRLAVLAGAASRLGTSVITLCSGTRDPHDLWRPHPDNARPEAWRDLTASLEQALPLAETHQVTLALEPEVNNVVDSAAKARRLLDEMRSPRLKIVMDGANLFPAGTLPRMREMLTQAFDLLGPDVVLGHAKDLSHDGDAGHLAAGTGRLDYDHYLGLFRRAGFRGALILHSLAESEVARTVAFLRARLAAAAPEVS